MRKVVINFDECLGDGVCEDICPEVFSIGDDNLACVNETAVTTDLENKIQEAIDECPCGAICWKED